MSEEAIFRSADVSLVQLYIPSEISREAVYALGEADTIQFRDLNSKVNTFQRSFVNEIRRLTNVERQYNYFKEQLNHRGVPLKPAPYIEDQEFTPAAKPSDIDEKVESAQLLEERLSQLVDASENLETRKKDLLQSRHVLKAANQFFNKEAEHVQRQSFDLIDTDDHDIEQQQQNQNAAISENYVTGVIPTEKANILEKILWRVLRGNLILETVQIEDPIYDPKSKQYINKSVFIVFSHGHDIISRIKKISESLDADLYEVDTEENKRSESLLEVNGSLEDLNTVLETTNRTLNTELIAIAQELSSWAAVILKEKSVYQTLNLFDYDPNRKVLIAEGWVPTNEIPSLKETLDSTSTDVSSVVNILQTTKTPPTYHKTNKFTAAFQSIVDAYGIAEYKEVNPGLPTIVTFPFMFAIMFGDMGHGFILSLAALFLVSHEKQFARIKRDEIFDMAFTGRYILLLMGLFSIFTGFLYNDLFSKSMTIFNSGWKWPEHHEGETIFAEQTSVYPIGLDPAWHGTENALLFTNSYKMKLSILMGFIHMTYSYFFSLVNHLHFKSVIDIIGNFIPGLLFMQSIFGYLSICIVYKWSIDWISLGKPAPGLLNMLISMFLSPGTVEEYLYPHQEKVQVFLLIIALICVPWLLLLKPLYFKYKIDQEHKYQELNADPEAVQDLPRNPEELQAMEHDDDDEEGEEGHNFGDIMIHQVIHTIEFCLNSVSHTASYLRLWALSLAHAQLSTVLWSMTIQNAFGATGITGVIMTVFLFGMWFVLTVVILVIMEGTSAMLHSLRLHWVESMSKFFVGGGKIYTPFSFKSILAEQGDLE
ncbi:V-type H+-transporting ATPase subunit I [Wickerhamomyces ciferrii]|uniref:V-type proton ATPase subunit a n=1 Tax=Wickerhamomyces ciferrii (strain ATCC 14091 / BCRC 22168 / CBS 111 / JCM 3599 / NBRC 0793 / NRRL Y-1031 F-60-10) TaxID=1206466 RepID=K0KC71_WICCF|nr:V-type H+-transporting ATPase subunit I [Wickerhamomyces ciferrii]CCH40496.1 V-type H+-transporting ATPase subunit I [Wickerhamomyces ciferrii]